LITPRVTKNPLNPENVAGYKLEFTTTSREVELQTSTGTGVHFVYEWKICCCDTRLKHWGSLNDLQQQHDQCMAAYCSSRAIERIFDFKDGGEEVLGAPNVEVHEYLKLEVPRFLARKAVDQGAMKFILK